MVRRILKWVLRTIVAFVVLSVLWVLLYRFVNPPVTATQAADALWGNGAARIWLPIERIDRAMVRAAIAGEDGKFCAHHGFDRRAMEQAMRRNAAGGRSVFAGATQNGRTHV